MTGAELLQEAERAAKVAYCPYSKFRVGAAVWAGGRLFSGCNVENASYGLTVCAERVALFGMAAAGVRRFDLLAVVCPDAADDAPPDRPGCRMPCGACRQVMAEFATWEARVLVGGVGMFTMDALLPNPFRLAVPEGTP